jgi:hypothetical protein
MRGFVAGFVVGAVVGAGLTLDAAARELGVFK